jgi:hypothetical protein
MAGRTLCISHNITRDACRILLWKRVGKKPFERNKPRYKDDIKMDLTITGWEGVD